MMLRDFLKIRVQETTAKILGGEVAAVRSKDILRTGARLFRDDGTVASAARVGSCGEDELFESCVKNSPLALPADGVPQGAQVGAWDLQAPGSADPELSVRTANRQLEILAAELPHFLFRGQTTVTKKSLTYSNSLGSELSLSCDEFSFVYDFRRKGSPNIVDGYFYQTDHGGFRTEEDLRWGIEQFRAYDRVEKIRPGRHKLLLLPDETALRKLGESLRADSYSEGTALYSRRLGERIFSERLSLSDLRLVPERGGIAPFDYEGTIAKAARTELLTKGALSALVSDRKNEKRHGVASTGNGFRDFNSSIRLDFSQLAVEPGARDFREILRDAGEVIVCQVSAGGDLTSQGDFSTPVQMAFLARNGEITGRLPTLSISSTLEKMFGADLLEVAANGPYRNSPQPFLLTEFAVQLGY